MTTYLIGYELNRARGDDDYPELIAAIKTAGNGWWSRQLASIWLIKSDETAVSLRDRLMPLIDSGDELLVIEVTRNAAWAGYSQEESNFSQQVSGWLQAKL